MIDDAEVRRRLEAVTVALRAIGAWDVPAPTAEDLARGGAFGAETMSFVTWLRHVFVPSVEARLAEGGPWPDGSELAVRATREADGAPELTPLLDPLQRFDELFEDTPPKAQLERAERLHAEGRFEEAIAAATAAAAREPTLPNACNYAGWLLLRDPDDDPPRLERALDFFARAVALDPSAVASAANYGNTLLRLGRDEEAFAWMEARTANAETAAAADNWIGWWRLQRGDGDSAVLHFRRAVGRRPRWGIARRNLGEALERTGHSDEAYDVLDPRRGDFDDGALAYAHERRGAFEARQGWLRSALGSMRRALYFGERAGSSRLEACREGALFLEKTLLANAIEHPSQGDHRRWIEDPKLVHAERALLERFERAAASEIPKERTAVNEEGAPLAELVLAAGRLADARAWGAVAELLEGAPEVTVDARFLAERAADAARLGNDEASATRLYGLALGAAQQFASWATSGGEGLARMVDVERLRGKLAKP